MRQGCNAAGVPNHFHATTRDGSSARAQAALDLYLDREVARPADIRYPREIDAPRSPNTSAVKRTPFDALLKLRQQRREDAVRALGKRVAETQVERAALDQVVTKKAQVQHAAAERRAHEQERASVEETRAVDWQRLAAYELSMRAEVRALEQREAVAQRLLDDARANETRARASVTQRDAEARVVDARRERFESQLRAREEQNLEEDALDLHNARRLGE